jgi:starch-binding outer membrane protein, SusD/RagB family
MRNRQLQRGIEGFVIASLVLGTAACDVNSLLDVDAPSQVPSERLETPRNAALLVNGAIADFECAYGAFVMVMGVMSDELQDKQLGAAGWFYDRRDAGLNPGSAYGTSGCSNPQTPGVYVPISTARWSADNALNFLDQWSDAEVPNRGVLATRAALYSAFSYNLLGMAMCSAAIDGGPEVNSRSLLEAAEERFTRAIQLATGAGLAQEGLAARAGRARVRLYLGNGPGARGDAEQIPLSFVFNATAAQDNTRRYNRVFHSNILTRNYGVAVQSRGLTTGGVEDPRSRSRFAGSNAVDGTPLWVQEKYPNYNSPIPIVTGGEMALVRAEVLGGQQAVDLINQLRDRHSLPRFAGGTEAEIREAIIEERRRELWLQGHRQYDIGRFNVPRVPATGTPYPKGGVYGDTTCLPLPDVERFNNPNIS